jgi:cell division septation protein DedD
MDDDFDLFPKRENLDPFSFKTREKKTEKQEESESLFDQEDAPAPPLPEAPLEEHGTKGPESVDTLPTLESFSPDKPPPAPEAPLEQVFEVETAGPISEEKTFDEPVSDTDTAAETSGKKKRKTPSPFIVVGGALIIIIGLLYGALTFLKREKPSGPPVSTPAVSVAVEPQTSAPVPAPEPPKSEEQTAVEPAGDKPPASESTEAALPEQQESPTQEPPAQEPPAQEPPTQEPPTQEPAPQLETPPAVTAPAKPVSDGARYSIQVGALILDSSVQALEKKLDTLGYDTFRKQGSTTAMMSMLTVGPFSNTDEAQKALSLLKNSGIDSSLVRRSEGGAVINAGSYLLKENADSIMRKIRAMGYPVQLSKKEARLPMTFVRVGRFEGIEEANSVRDELKVKGVDAIVVKLQ